MKIIVICISIFCLTSLADAQDLFEAILNNYRGKEEADLICPLLKSCLLLISTIFVVWSPALIIRRRSFGSTNDVSLFVLTILLSVGGLKSRINPTKKLAEKVMKNNFILSLRINLLLITTFFFIIYSFYRSFIHNVKHSMQISYELCMLDRILSPNLL